MDHHWPVSAAAGDQVRPRSAEANTRVRSLVEPGPNRSCDATQVPSGRTARLGEPMYCRDAAGLVSITVPGTDRDSSRPAERSQPAGPAPHRPAGRRSPGRGAGR